MGLRPVGRRRRPVVRASPPTWPAASMGLRPVGRRRAVVRRKCSRKRNRLQWGSVRLDGEGWALADPVPDRFAASMGLRPVGRRRDGKGHCGSGGHHASMGLRPVGRRRDGKGHCGSGGHHASMGLRPVGRRRCSTGAGFRTGASGSFNGAPSGWTEKESDSASR